MSFPQQELAYYDQLFNVVDKDDAGVLPGQDVLPFLVSSGLPQQTLGEIWALADPENNGFLTKEGWYRAARLIGWVQKGGHSTVDPNLASKPGPYPSFQGQPPPPPQAPTPAQPTGQRPPTLSTQVTGSSLPPLTAADRTKFTRIFVGCGPQNGLISGDKARDVFVKSQLGYDKLGQIWTLADTQQRGSLDLPDFIIGMYLIQASMANPMLVLPPTLPPGTYEQASGGRPPPTSPIARQNTGTQSPVRPQYTGQASVLQPQQTGQSVSTQPTGTPSRGGVSSFASPAASAFPSAPFAPSRQMSGAQQPWDVTPGAKATSDRFFTTLDPQDKGFIEGDVAVPFMLQSQLDEGVLASIWDLADIRQEGKLSRDEFAVAMHLINTKLAGQDIPASLPNSLIPPSLRAEYGSGTQEVLSPGTGSTAKDLFDLFDDSSAPPAPAHAAPTPPPAQPFTTAFLQQPPSRKPTATPGSRQMSPAPSAPASGFGMAPFAPAAASDLLGDDAAEAPRAVPDKSAEIGNKRNQLANTERAVGDLEKARGELERTAADSSKQLEELDQKLSSARVRHEAETKTVADLRIRVGEQAVKLKQLNADVISAESDLTAMRLEKDELEQALLRDKEEVRGLQRRMKEVEDEKSGFKMVLEKLKKEARQQRGMVSIAKKQLSTAEGGRDSVQQEIREAEKAAEGPESVEEVHPAVAFSPSTLSTAAAVPLPATPKALSPAPTGTSQRSNNPFDRLGKAKAASPPEVTSPSLETTSPSFGTAALLGAGATVGAAAGVVAAGASTLFTAAKDVVVGEHEGSKEAEEPKQAEEPKRTQELQGATTPFGATQAPSAETDPFGAPATSGPTQTMFDNEFDAGFGDSFSSNKAVPAKQTAQFARGTDFDTAFADFDEVPEPAPELVAPGVPKVEEQHPPVEEVHEALPEGIPLGIPKSAIPADLRPEAERSLSTQAIPPSSVAETPLTEEPTSVEPEQPPEDAAPALEPENNASSDEEEGPEDLEAPRGYMSKMKEADDVASPVVAAPPGLSAPVTSETSEPAQKTRRSAPPPPAAKSAAPALNDFDPLGAPITTATATTATAISPTLDADQQPPGAAPPSHAPQTSSFDDDDFDFSDLPPAQVEQPGTNAEPAPLASSAFYDEFAGFDDEFDKPSTGRASDGSNGMSKSYEMVSPNQPSAPFKPEQEETSRHYDEWGFGGHKPVPAPTSGAAMSFDDAFGGDFEPAPTQQQQEQYYPPPGPPPAKEAALTPPPIPERRDSAAQPDDLEDVKKLCAMGFSRTLAVEALDANGYDFQKALNVLLVQ